MTNTSTESGAAPRAGLLSRFIGIITSPGTTFRSVVDHPAWFGMLALTVLVTVVLAAGPLFSEWGQQAALDQQVRMMESFGRTIDDAAYAQMQLGMKFAAYTTAIGLLVFSPIMALITSGILYVIFSVAMGGNATFKQQMAVTVHAGVIPTLALIFATPLNYVRGSLTSTTNFAVFFPMLDEDSFLARVLGVIDLFWIWYIVVFAIGLGVLYKRRTGPIAIGLLVFYALIAVCIALVRGMLGGTN
ncbi:MAG TPA: YIP1 family protein [Vicinamibacterales bacterium]|nr:YIP1 family protein [Vicinamibacterales bacterium]